MQTSRVRLALSSIQLFIERCLRNLEPHVNPADIDAVQWDWRKRYRVWQANREVFLWPENWLDESLRDDQSPFFQTTMNQLLQSDITDDDARLGLPRLPLEPRTGRQARPLRPVLPTGTAGSADDLAHVVARTGGAHRKHYYRRLRGGAWTPWEEVNLPIEDNPVVPYVWNDRLLSSGCRCTTSPGPWRPTATTCPRARRTLPARSLERRQQRHRQRRHRAWPTTRSPSCSISASTTTGMATGQDVRRGQASRPVTVHAGHLRPLRSPFRPWAAAESVGRVAVRPGH